MIYVTSENPILWMDVPLRFSHGRRVASKHRKEIAGLPRSFADTRAFRENSCNCWYIRYYPCAGIRCTVKVAHNFSTTSYSCFRATEMKLLLNKRDISYESCWVPSHIFERSQGQPGSLSAGNWTVVSWIVEKTVFPRAPSNRSFRLVNEAEIIRRDLFVFGTRASKQRRIIPRWFYGNRIERKIRGI